MSRVLHGAAIAAAIKQEVVEEVRALAAQGIRPGLAAVLVGHVPASEIYVRSKVQTCAELGLFSDLITPPDSVTTEEMLDLVAALAQLQHHLVEVAAEVTNLVIAAGKTYGHAEIAAAQSSNFLLQFDHGPLHGVSKYDKERPANRDRAHPGFRPRDHENAEVMRLNGDAELPAVRIARNDGVGVCELVGRHHDVSSSGTGFSLWSSAWKLAWTRKSQAKACATGSK